MHMSKCTCGSPARFVNFFFGGSTPLLATAAGGFPPVDFDGCLSAAAPGACDGVTSGRYPPPMGPPCFQNLASLEVSTEASAGCFARIQFGVRCRRASSRSSPTLGIPPCAAADLLGVSAVAFAVTEPERVSVAPNSTTVPAMRLARRS